MQSRLINLSRLAGDAPVPTTTPAVQASLVGQEVKDVIEQLIVEIRKQVSGGGETGPTNAFMYKADANVTGQSDPGTGKMRWNAEDQQAATALYFDWITHDGFDPVLYFKLMEAPQKFIVQDKDFHVNYQVWTLTAPVIEYPDWFEVPATLTAVNGPGVMANNALIAVLI